MIQSAKFGSYLPRTMWEEQVVWVAAEYVAQDLISYTCQKASKIAFLPDMDQVAKRRYNRIWFRRSTVLFVHCQPMLQLFEKLRGLFGDAVFQRSCPKERVQSFNSDHCWYSSSGQTPAPTSSSSRPRPPRVARPDYCIWSNLSSRLRNIVAFSSFCC